MNVFKCIIVDDVEMAIVVIEDFIKKTPELEVVETFTKSIEALKYLEKNKVDLVFLDIKMPVLDGLKLIECLREKMGRNIPSFVLTTGRPEFALSGYQQGAIGYLVKPIEFKEFKIAIGRILDSWKKNSAVIDGIVDKDYFFIESDGARIKLKYKDIAYLESDGNYIKLVENNVDRLIYNKPMHYIESILSNHGFVRVHKSYIVSMHYIKELRGSEILLNGFNKIIPVGSTYKIELQKRMNIL